MPPKATTLVDLSGRPENAQTPGFACLATIVSMQPDGTPEVHLDDDGPAVAARLAVAATRERLERAAAARQQIVVVFENGDPALPVIVGFIEQPVQEPTDEADLTVLQADVDGRRVKVTAKDEIVLECGRASVTLRRNGRVIIRGTYVETQSEGTNRIKGGQVQIN